jgi:hypothetical protein
MRTVRILATGLCMLALLAACAKPKPPPKVEDTVFGDVVSNKERAKQATEKAMQQNQDKLDQAMKQAEAATQ